MFQKILPDDTFQRAVYSVLRFMHEDLGCSESYPSGSQRHFPRAVRFARFGSDRVLLEMRIPSETKHPCRFCYIGD